jgi:hypothetical protein
MLPHVPERRATSPHAGRGGKMQNLEDQAKNSFPTSVGLKVKSALLRTMPGKQPSTKRGRLSRKRLSVIVGVAVVLVILVFVSLSTTSAGKAAPPISLTNYSWPKGQALTVFISNNSPSTVTLNGSSITFDGKLVRDSANPSGGYACANGFYKMLSGETCYIILDVQAPPGTFHVVGIMAERTTYSLTVSESG